MAKRTTDLLDVFRTSGGPPPRTAKRGNGKGRSKRADRGFEGVFLGPRQLLLVGCVLLLLVVLAFVLGLGMGRRGQGLSAATAIQRTTAESLGWYVLGRLDKYRTIGGDPIAKEQVAPELGLPARNVRVEERGGDRYDVYVGPFRSADEAEAFRTRRLAGIRFGGNWPFADIYYRVLELPRGQR